MSVVTPRSDQEAYIVSSSLADIFDSGIETKPEGGMPQVEEGRTTVAKHWQRCRKPRTLVRKSFRLRLEKALVVCVQARSRKSQHVEDSVVIASVQNTGQC